VLAKQHGQHSGNTNSQLTSARALGTTFKLFRGGKFVG